MRAIEGIFLLDNVLLIYRQVLIRKDSGMTDRAVGATGAGITIFRRLLARQLTHLFLFGAAFLWCFSRRYRLGLQVKRQRRPLGDVYEKKK